MVVRKIEIEEELLFKLGAEKSPRLLGECVSKFTKKGMECINIDNSVIFLINQALETANKLNKKEEVNERICHALKSINVDLINEV